MSTLTEKPLAFALQAMQRIDNGDKAAFTDLAAVAREMGQKVVAFHMDDTISPDTHVGPDLAKALFVMAKKLLEDTRYKADAVVAATMAIQIGNIGSETAEQILDFVVTNIENLPSVPQQLHAAMIVSNWTFNYDAKQKALDFIDETVKSGKIPPEWQGFVATLIESGHLGSDLDEDTKQQEVMPLALQVQTPRHSPQRSNVALPSGEQATAFLAALNAG